VGLGVATSYSVVAGQTVTNTGPSLLGGDIGLSPGTAITGFPPGHVDGKTHTADATAANVESAVLHGWTVAAGRAPTSTVAGDIVGQTLTAGVYKSTSSLALGGTVTLDAQGDPASVFVFQIASTLITATSSTVALINGAQACNVYWQVGSSATLGTTSDFKGTIMALTSISVGTGATVEGRALAHNGAVTLDDNVFTAPGCNTTPVSSSAPPSSPTTTRGSGSGTTSTPAGSTTTATTRPTHTSSGTPSVPRTTASRVPQTGAGSLTQTSTALGTDVRSVSAPAGRDVSTPVVTLAAPRTPASTGTNVLGTASFGASLILLGGAILMLGRRTRRLRPRRH
jgi:type VI secretion system secreted protein VgrG